MLAAVKKLAEKSFTAKADGDDVTALSAHLSGRGDLVWTKDGVFTSKGTAVLEEIKRAADWGLEPAAFDLPQLTPGTSPEAQGEAEARVWLAALKYARFAKGGRIDPLSVSNIWDMTPPLKDPKVVVAELSEASDPAAYLTSLHPKHEGFVKLREALLKARGQQEEPKIDEALKIKLPDGDSIKPGQEHADIALLRQRLKIEAQSASNERLYDARLEAAVRAFQEEKGLKANGTLNAKTRRALNADGEPKKPNPKGETDRIIANMERWRWLPDDLGALYVMNNIPEFVGRVYKGKDTVWEEKIIVGQPTWPTPMLTAKMEFVIFHPEWGVPDGIKVKELLPRLKRAGGGGGGFFDQLFGGGSSGGGRVLAAYGLRPSINGRPVDPDKVDWNRVDIRQFSFIQPAGGQNPLGEVKFRFPNRHDVYMHDTTQRNLFAESFRALSHGCIRVQNPHKLAEIILGDDKGYSADKVEAMFNGSGDVTLEKPVPVYLAYFTVRVDSEGKLRTFADVYGNDERVLSAIAGKPVKYNAPDHSKEDFVADGGYDPESSYTPAAAPQGNKKTLNKKAAQQQARKRSESTNDILSNVLEGLISN